LKRTSSQGDGYERIGLSHSRRQTRSGEPAKTKYQIAIATKATEMLMAHKGVEHGGQ
jgi:hypothetical protein